MKTSSSLLHKIRILIPSISISISTLAFTSGFIPFSKFFIIQMGPNILNVFASFSSILLLVVIVTLILTFLFGRFYCSFICPFGILQEFISWGSKKKYIFIKNQTVIRYMIASVSFGLFFGGWSIAFRFLDPFSNFGSIISSTVSLIYSKIIPTDFADKTYVIKFFSTGIIPLFVIVFLVLWKKRIFCVAICPVGTLLGLFSKWGLFRLKINEKCVKCSKCASICGAGAIDLKEKKINNETCMRCLKCIDHCPIKAIQYGIGKKETRKTLIFNPSRREFLATGIGVVIAIACSKISGYVKPSEKALLNKNFSTIFPPGSVSSDLFLSKCTSCLLCLNNCKGGAIKSPNSKVETVYLDYNKGFCHYECNNCSQVCPTGAIRKISLEEKKITRIGMAVFNYETCLKCKICYAKCPTGAIKLNENGFPLLEGQYCIGCGSCQYNCPAKGEKYPAVRIVASFAQAEATATVSK